MTLRPIGRYEKQHRPVVWYTFPAKGGTPVCTFVLVTLFIVSMLTSVYVIIAELVSATLIYEWYFFYLPRRKKQQQAKIPA